MPLLLLGLLGVPLVLTTGALAVRTVSDSMNDAAPNVALIAALGLAGFVLWKSMK